MVTVTESNQTDVAKKMWNTYLDDQRALRDETVMSMLNCGIPEKVVRATSGIPRSTIYGIKQRRAR